MAYGVLAGPVLLMFFIFAWGSAPCWHFERLWRKKFGMDPDEEKLVQVGLAPASRRQFSFAIIAIISILLFILVWVVSASPIEELAVVALASAVIGGVAGYMLHHLGAGKKKIIKFFENL